MFAQTNKKTKRFPILQFAFGLIFMLFNTYMHALKPTSYHRITFVNVSDKKIQESFLEVYKKYTNLQEVPITIVQKRMGSTTMQAQPILNFNTLFCKKKAYKIMVGKYLKDTDILLSKVPKGVLKGWFAHELGHITDYEKHTTIGMLWYGIKYSISPSFKKKVEHTADYIALKKGFKEALLKTKRYILLSNVFSSTYLRKIHQYYLPLEAVKKYVAQEEKAADTTLSKMYHK